MQIKMLSALLILLAINFSTADKFSFEGYHLKLNWNSIIFCKHVLNHLRYHLIRLLPTNSLHIDFLIVAQNNPEV